MCGGRPSTLRYGPLIETNTLYTTTPNGSSLNEPLLYNHLYNYTYNIIITTNASRCTLWFYLLIFFILYRTVVELGHMLFFVFFRFGLKSAIFAQFVFLFAKIYNYMRSPSFLYLQSIVVYVH